MKFVSKIDSLVTYNLSAKIGDMDSNEGLTPRDRQMVELMCNETFEDKDPNEAMEYLDLLVENAQNWDTVGTYEAPSKTQPHTSSGGMYNLKEDHDLQAKFASLARKVEALELKRSGSIKICSRHCVSNL